MKWVDVPIGMMWQSGRGNEFIRVGPDEGFNMSARYTISDIGLVGNLAFKRYVGYIPPELL